MTFTHPKTNALLTENTDWAVDTPEYKFTRVKIKKSNDEIYELKETKPVSILEQFNRVYLFFEKYPTDLRLNLIVNHIRKNWDVNRINELKFAIINDEKLNKIIKEI